jgi:hypothetical protein
MATDRSRTAWLVTGAIVAAATIVFGTFSLVSLLAHERSVETQAVAGDIARVEVRLDAGTVRVVAGPEGQATVVSHVSEGLRSPERSVSLDGNALLVDGRCSAVLNTWCGLDVELSVPADADVLVRASAGGVRVEDLRGDLDLVSSAGRVRGLRLGSERAVARSSAGSVTLEYVDAPTSVEASSSAGSVSVVVPRSELAYRVEAASSAGSTQVDVRTNPASDRTITVRSSAGSVTVRYPDG